MLVFVLYNKGKNSPFYRFILSFHSIFIMLYIKVGLFVFYSTDPFVNLLALLIQTEFIYL